MDLCRLYEDLIRSIFTFLAEMRISAPHASSAGDMMAVHQTPFNYSVVINLPILQIGVSVCRSTIIFCSVATIPLSGLYSCIFASFSLDTAGTASLAGGPAVMPNAGKRRACCAGS